MKKYILFTFVVLFSFSCNEKDKKGKGGGGKGKAEVGVPAPRNGLSGSSSVESVDKPSYIDGDEELKKFIAKNIVIPDSIKQLNISGKVCICLTIDKKGDIINYELVSTIKHCPGCTTEAIRLLKSIPKWKPAYTIDEKENRIAYTEKLLIDIPFKK
jgi:hypothetical protein